MKTRTDANPGSALPGVRRTGQTGVSQGRRADPCDARRWATADEDGNPCWALPCQAGRDWKPPVSSRLGGWHGRLASAPKPTSVQYMRSHQGTKAQRVRHFPRWGAPAWRGICPDHTARRGGRLVRAVRRRHPEFQSFTIVPHTKARRHEVEAGALCALRGSVCVSCIAEFVTPWGV